MNHVTDLYLMLAIKEINSFYKPGTLEWIKAHQKGLWIQIIDLEEKINQAILKGEEGYKIENLLQEYVKKWKVGHARQRSLFDEKKG